MFINQCRLKQVLRYFKPLVAKTLNGTCLAKTRCTGSNNERGVMERSHVWMYWQASSSSSNWYNAAALICSGCHTRRHRLVWGRVWKLASNRMWTEVGWLKVLCQPPPLLELKLCHKEQSVKDDFKWRYIEACLGHILKKPPCSSGEDGSGCDSVCIGQTADKNRLLIKLQLPETGEAVSLINSHFLSADPLCLRHSGLFTPSSWSGTLAAKIKHLDVWTAPILFNHRSKVSAGPQASCWIMISIRAADHICAATPQPSSWQRQSYSLDRGWNDLTATNSISTAFIIHKYLKTVLVLFGHRWIPMAISQLELKKKDDPNWMCELNKGVRHRVSTNWKLKAGNQQHQ